MRSGIMLAIFASVSLVGAASWSRLTKGSPQDNLVAVESMELPDAYYQEILAGLLEPGSAASTTTERQPLTATDLIGQQLIIDYIQMAANGQAGQASIEALAERYVEGLPTLTRAPTIGYDGLKIVSNTNINFLRYEKETSEIYEKYKSSMQRAGAGETDIDSLDPAALYSSMDAFAAAYAAAAEGLKTVPVPGSIARAHLELVNLFLSTTEAMRALAGAQNDSARAFAGLITLSGNMDKEQSVLSEIDDILGSNGI